MPHVNSREHCELCLKILEWSLCCHYVFFVDFNRISYIANFEGFLSNRTRDFYLIVLPWCLFVNFVQICFGVSIVYFKQVNADWKVCLANLPFAMYEASENIVNL